jgi:hypothetical protein
MLYLDTVRHMPKAIEKLNINQLKILNNPINKLLKICLLIEENTERIILRKEMNSQVKQIKAAYHQIL